jgi:hypothetical protein
MSTSLEDRQYLNDENLILQLINYGYFPEQIPACFSTKRMAEYLNILV